MKELWISVVEVLTDSNAGGGDTRAFTNVVTWASSVADYVNSVSAVFEKYGWVVLGTENARPIAREIGFNEEISDIIERAKINPEACIFGAFHYYPSRPA